LKPKAKNKKKKKKTTTKTCYIGKNLIQACKVMANLTLGREVWRYQDRKAAARHAFSTIPIYYLQNFLKTNKREYKDRKDGSTTTCKAT